MEVFGFWGGGGGKGFRVFEVLVFFVFLEVCWRFLEVLDFRGVFGKKVFGFLRCSGFGVVLEAFGGCWMLLDVFGFQGGRWEKGFGTFDALGLLGFREFVWVGSEVLGGFRRFLEVLGGFREVFGGFGVLGGLRRKCWALEVFEGFEVF